MISFAMIIPSWSINRKRWEWLITTQPSRGQIAQVLAENVLESGVVATGHQGSADATIGCPWLIEEWGEKTTVSRIESCKMYIGYQFATNFCDITVLRL